MVKGLLLVAFDFSEEMADEFHDWYDLEHIPERQAVAGFRNCQRWLDATGARRAVATYDLDTVDVLQSPAYRAIAGANLSPWSKRITGKCSRLMRFEGVQFGTQAGLIPTEAGGLLVNAMNVAAEAEEDFNAWYDEEHLPALTSVPGVLAARRYVASDGTHGGQRYVAIYYLRSADVVLSDAWKAAADTPWSTRVRPYFRDRIRILNNRYVR